VIAARGGWRAGLRARGTVCTALVVLTLVAGALAGLTLTEGAMDGAADAHVDGHAASPHGP